MNTTPIRSPLEILIAEDSPTQAEKLKCILEENDFRVVTVCNGQKALEAMRARKPILVITDINMPEMDGYELCRRIRADGQLGELPVILLTSLSDPEDVFKGLECGADNFITKPYDENNLLARIQYLLANVHLRKREKTQTSMEVFFAGRKHVITSDRAQILNLLLSTYETAVQKNRELAGARDELATLNGQLEEKVVEEHRRAEQLKEYSKALAEKQEQIEQELVLAREVQEALLPQSYPSFPRGVTEAGSAIRFAHRYLPEGRIGGDFFTVVPVSDTQAGVLICDVMGHGVPAALVTAVMRVLVEEVQSLAGTPGAFLGELNLRLHHFFEPLPMSMFVTALYMIIDTVTGAVRFANAGHPHPLHIRRDPIHVRTMGDNQARPPFVLGVAKDSVYPTEEDAMKPGDLLLLYTDGLCDLGEGKDLTPDAPQFLSLVESCARHRGKAVLDALLTQARQFSGQNHFLDDVCLVGIEIERLEALATKP
jgi:serine phosphatase RsbU (regulator of sigma subunit)/ActR/RegA family two-component response regulator